MVDGVTVGTHVRIHPWQEITLSKTGSQRGKKRDALVMSAHPGTN